MVRVTTAEPAAVVHVQASRCWGMASQAAFAKLVVKPAGRLDTSVATVNVVTCLVVADAE